MKHGAKLDIKAHFGLTPLDYSALFIAEKNIRIEKDCPFKDELKERMQYSKETGIKIYSELLKEEESEMQIDKEFEKLEWINPHGNKECWKIILELFQTRNYDMGLINPHL